VNCDVLMNARWILNRKNKKNSKEYIHVIYQEVKNMKFITLSGLMYLMCTKGQIDFIFSELLW